MTDISKIDMDRIEGLISKLESMKYVIETWKEGTSWYRIWSDGWIEQGGILPASATGTLTFKIPFSDNTYTVLFGERVSGSDSDGVDFTTGILTSNISVNGFNFTQVSSRNTYYYICGY